MQKDADVSILKSNDLYEIGTLAKILQVLRLPDNKYRLLVRGEERVRLTDVDSKELVWTSEVEHLEVPTEDERDLELMIQVVHEQFERVSQLDSAIPEEMVQSIVKNFDASKLADSLIPHVCSKPEEQQKLLEMLSSLERLNRITEILQEKAEVLVVDKRIRERVKEQMEKNQKEYYLNEKMQAIQKELGDEEEEVSEFVVLKGNIEKAEMPEETATIAFRELTRLKKMNPMSAEATVSRSYLDWLIALPWNRYAEENADLKRAREILEEEHYGLRDV
jgi:ATP-dependent Lon protease